MASKILAVALAVVTYLLVPSQTRAQNAPEPQDKNREERPICKIGGTLQEGWYVFAQDNADHWKGLECPRPPTMDDAHYNVWRTAPVDNNEVIYACRDTPLPRGYSVIEKTFKSECPWTGMNVIGEAAPNAYKLARETSGPAPPSPVGKQDPDARASGPESRPEPPAKQKDALEHVYLGNDYFATRRYGEAALEFREATRLDPASSDWPALLALALVLQDRADEAEIEAQIAVRLDPKNAVAHSALAAALGSKGQWKEAEIESRLGMRLDPDSTRGIPGLSQLLLGISLWRLGKKDQAEQEFRELVARYERYRGKLAELLLEVGKLEEAEAQYREALTRQPDDMQLTKGLDAVLKARAPSR